MPTLTIDGDELLVHLAALERLAAFHFHDVRFPLASVTDVAVEPNVWTALRGIRAPGTGIPNVIAYGTRRHAGGKDLVLVTGGRRPGLRVDFGEGAPYSRLVITLADPQEQANVITRAQRGP
jgi:hypothetical protein